MKTKEKKMIKPVKDQARTENIKHPQGNHYQTSMHDSFPPPQDVDGGDMQMEPGSGTGAVSPMQ